LTLILITSWNYSKLHRTLVILGDDLDLLTDHLKMIRERGDDCLSFGGIGATPDDRTRQAMARAHDQQVVRHPQAVELLEKQFGEEAYPNRILMAELPEGAGLIPNSHNNIPGFYCGRIHCLPGFPEMAWPMIDWVVNNRYETDRDQTSDFKSYVVSGAKESELVPLLTSCQDRFPGVKFSSLPHFFDGTRWQVELGVRGNTRQVSEGAKMLLEGIHSFVLK